MEPRRYLRCLGQPALFAPNGEPIRFRTKKHLALLVYLAVEPGPAHRRERLAEFLWPKARVSEARHSLATALSILRARLGADVLQATRDHVSLPSGHLALDLDRLRAGDVLGDETSSPLQVAAFLDGFEIADAGEFALWKDRQQAKLLPAIKDALVVLIDRCRRTADSHQIEQLADRMLSLDELSEEAIRAKMEARAFAGDRLTALKIFEEWKVKLLEELGASPSDLVEGMAVRLRRRGWERTTRTDIPTVPTDQWRGRAFIGRGSEYRVLYEAWESLGRGVPVHPLVLGDSGIGKTTLVERLTTAAGLEGAAVSRVQCYDLEREIPYATVGSLIHGLLDRPGVSGTPPEALAELARTVPEVRRRFPTLPPSSDSQGEAARLRLTEAFHEMLQAIADEHPVILVVDDLHHADDASLAMLHLIMRRAKQQRIMVTMIARAGELPRSPQAHRLREGGRGLGIREVEVGPLDVDESKSLLRALLPPDGPQPTALARRALLKGAAGVPMVLVLLAQDWEEHGDDSLALALDAMTTTLRGAAPLPRIYQEALDRIVEVLDPGTRSVMNLASILGPRLNHVELYALADLGIGQTMTGMAELVSRRVLRDGGKGLEFANELLRAAVYCGVPSPLRNALHSHIADRLLREDENRDEPLGLEIAWHCIRAGREAEGTSHLLRGAQDAIRLGAPHGAESALTSAMPHLSGGAKEEASLLLAQVLQEQGRWLESLDVLTLLRQEASNQAQEKSEALVSLAKLRLGTRLSSLQGDIHQLMDIVRLSSDHGTRAMAGRTLAYVLGELHESGMSRELLALLSTVPAEALSPDAFGQLALARALLLYQVGESEKSFNLASSAIAELQRRRAANLVMVQLNGGLGSIRSKAGNYEAAIAHFEHAFALATQLGNDDQAATIIGNIALCYGRLGQYAEQISWASKVMSRTSPEFTGFVEMQLAYSEGFGHGFRRRPDLVLAAINSMEARLIGAIPPWMRQAWAFWKADLLLIAKQGPESHSTARAALDEFDFRLESPGFAGPFARWTALTLFNEDRKRAHALVGALAARLEAHDALDRVEILCALAFVESDPGTRHATVDQIDQRLRGLPPAIRLQLNWLGVLPVELAY